MQRYKCSNCNKVFCGWAVRYKLKYKCPVCGGELKKEVYPDNETGNKKFQKNLTDKIFKIRDRKALSKN
ncbi:unnamed protein product [marine sediment metagenome]|uniref:Uncharacterized protein n=2 Tax=marine sediment metagenome TaxID=412755 RepID=X1Q790_9ZZZZ